mmetsp:Transcript_11364/g.34237  ORF Transcript_11364/g.34237 Transcript_11364/m.34237 type:complete len:304 (+) Transcript_11364:159-1070(+)
MTFFFQTPYSSRSLSRSAIQSSSNIFFTVPVPHPFLACSAGFTVAPGPLPGLFSNTGPSVATLPANDPESVLTPLGRNFFGKTGIVIWPLRPMYTPGLKGLAGLSSRCGTGVRDALPLDDDARLECMSELFAFTPTTCSIGGDSAPVAKLSMAFQPVESPDLSASSCRVCITPSWMLPMDRRWDLRLLRGCMIDADWRNSPGLKCLVLRDDNCLPMDIRALTGLPSAVNSSSSSSGSPHAGLSSASKLVYPRLSESRGSPTDASAACGAFDLTPRCLAPSFLPPGVVVRGRWAELADAGGEKW